MDDVNQKKKMILLGITCVGILAVVILIVLIVLQANEAKKTKVQIGETVLKTKTVDIQNQGSQDVYRVTYIIDNRDKKNPIELPFILTTPDKKEYYNIKVMAEKFCGYVYNKGIYGGVPDESQDKCHIVHNKERVSFSSTSEEIIKYIEYPDNSSNAGELAFKDKMENSKLEEDVEIISFAGQQPVIKFDDQLYASVDAIEIGFDMNVSRNGSTITIYPLESLITLYTKTLQDNNYKLTSNFKNQRALYEGLAVCQEGNYYCVVKIENGTTNKVISSQYSAIEYVQGISNFITGTTDKTGATKFGMNSPIDGTVIIPANYDSLQLLDAKNSLYLTEKDGRFGVINPTKEDPVVLPNIYEQIGLDSVKEYANQGISNKYILDDYTIITKRNGKYGLATKDGYTLLLPRYKGFGCSNPSQILKDANGTDITANPTLIIPLPNNLKCIVVQDKDTFGLLDLKTGSIIIQAYYTAIYSAEGNGETKYYFHKVISGEDDQIETLDSKLKSTKELIRYVENFANKEQSEETLKKQSERENAKMEKEDAESSSGGGDDEEYDEEYDDDSEEEYDD